MVSPRRWLSRRAAYPLFLTIKSVQRRAGWHPMRWYRKFHELARSEPAVWREFRDRQAPPGGMHVGHTGGSTGQPTHYWHDHRHDAIRLMAMYRDKSYSGWRPGDRVAVLEARRALFWRATLARRVLNWLGGVYTGLNVHDLDRESALRFQRRLERHRPVVIRGIASAIDEYARILEEEGLAHRARGLGLRGVIAACEKLYPHQRERVERVFGCAVFDLYGSCEMGYVAMECAAHDGLHVSADTVVVEILDDEGHPVPAGSSGRVVVTDPWNLGFSLIRYDLGDVGRYLPDGGPCPCGVTFPKLAPVEGTLKHFFRLPDGSLVHGGRFTGVVIQHPAVRQFRVVQEAPEEIVVYLVGDRQGAEGIERELQAEAPARVRFRVEWCDDLPPTPAGKRIYYLSRLSGELQAP